MSKDPFFMALDVAMKHISREADKADSLASAIYGLIEGGDPDYAMSLLKEYGYVDEDGEWNAEDE